MHEALEATTAYLHIIKQQFLVSPVAQEHFQGHSLLPVTRGGYRGGAWGAGAPPLGPEQKKSPADITYDCRGI